MIFLKLYVDNITLIKTYPTKRRVKSVQCINLLLILRIDSSCRVKNAYHRHEAIAAQYVIVDRDKNVEAYECFIGDDKVSEKLQQ